MRAALYDRHGDVEELYVGELPRPEPAAGEVLLRVRAVALNGFDPMMLQGSTGIRVPFPMVPCGDAAGEVAGFGPGTDPGPWRVGDRAALDPVIENRGMMGEKVLGVAREYVAVPLKNLVPVPDGVSLEAAAAVPVAYGTAQRVVEERASHRAWRDGAGAGSDRGRRRLLRSALQARGRHGDRDGQRRVEAREAEGIGRRPRVPVADRGVAGPSQGDRRTAPLPGQGRRRRGRRGQLHRRRHLGRKPQDPSLPRAHDHLRRHRRLRPADRHPLHLELRADDHGLRRMEPRRPLRSCWRWWPRAGSIPRSTRCARWKKWAKRWPNSSPDRCSGSRS